MEVSALFQVGDTIRLSTSKSVIVVLSLAGKAEGMFTGVIDGQEFDDFDIDRTWVVENEVK